MRGARLAEEGRGVNFRTPAKDHAGITGMRPGMKKAPKNIPEAFNRTNVSTRLRAQRLTAGLAPGHASNARPGRADPSDHQRNPSLSSSPVFSLSNFFSFFLCRCALHQEINFLSVSAAASSAGHLAGFFFL
jgi:hypothetical protein